MKIVFRVDASFQIGVGHVMRCLAIAKIFQNQGSDIHFICRNHQGNLIDKIIKEGFNVFILELSSEFKSNKNWLGDSQSKDSYECSKVFKKIRPDWLIIDHYCIDQEWQIVAREYCKKILVIDDLADRVHECDVLLDQTFGCQDFEYSHLIPDECKLLLGSKYAILRPEFLELRSLSLNRRKSFDLKKILISMGGADPMNSTCQVLDELSKIDLPNTTEVTIILGASSTHLDTVKAKANRLIYNTTVKTNIDNMAETMANSDLGIGACGTSTWERCCLGLPSIQIVTAENQKKIAKNLESQDIVKIVNSFDELVPSINYMINNLSKYSNKSKSIIDGKGLMRLVEILNY